MKRTQYALHVISNERLNSYASYRPPTKKLALAMNNVGKNTCFFNSVMQCLMHTIPLFNFLTQSEVHRMTLCMEPICLTCRMITYAKKVDQGAITDDNVKYLLELMPKYMPGFEFGKQQDAGECLMAILSAMIESQFRFKEVLDHTFVKMHSFLTPLGKMFLGITNNEKQCLHCRRSGHCSEQFINLDLKFKYEYMPDHHGVIKEEPITFHEMMETAFSSEIMDDEYECTNCHKKKKA